jgi:hypothetical protein
MFGLNFFEFVIGLVLIGSVAGIIQQGIKLERDKVRASRRAAEGNAAELGGIVSDLHKDVARLKDRVRVLEKLVTDDDRRLADEIERLRREDGRPRAGA